MASVTTEFDIFAPIPVQEAVQETVEVTYKHIAIIGLTDLEFNIPAHNEIYMDINIQHFVSGKLSTADRKDLNTDDYKAVTNNFLQSLFSQCTIYLNGVPITQSSQHYNYRSTVQTLLSYGNDAAHLQLTNAICYLDTGERILSRWNLCK
jgi:hypothetical protein